jgi:GH24 family phage-related lysozyme (muramidase)
MYQSVADAFVAFSTPFEGRVNHMYLDIKGLVTTGIGNLIDPVDSALAVEFVHNGDGDAASEDEIRSEWQSLKDDKDALAAAGWRACRPPRTQLTITDSAIDQLVSEKLFQFEATLRATTAQFASLDDWPADAQLGVLSMAWAMGPAFGTSWPNFRAAVEAGDWRGAASNCRMNEAGNPGLRPRNDANEQLFNNAAGAVDQGLDFSTLRYAV